MEHKLAIELIDLKKHFLNGSQSPLYVLSGITAFFKQGVSYAITGVSGSGKSTLLYLMAGLDHPSSGSIIVDGQLVSTSLGVCEATFFTHKLGLVFQKPHVMKEFTVLENVMLKSFGLGQSSDKNQAYELLKEVGLLEKAQEYPAVLSGGQQQRLALARALYGRPSFLIADEPTAHLDSENKKLVLDLMVKLCAQQGMGLVISTHDPEAARRMDITYNLVDGILSPQAYSNKEQIKQSALNS